jgi:hypothetical protein
MLSDQGCTNPPSLRGDGILGWRGRGNVGATLSNREEVQSQGKGLSFGRTPRGNFDQFSRAPSVLRGRAVDIFRPILGFRPGDSWGTPGAKLEAKDFRAKPLNLFVKSRASPGVFLSLGDVQPCLRTHLFCVNSDGRPRFTRSAWPSI